jgi:hypothetical protein
MLHDIRITAAQVAALGGWVEDCEFPAAVELAVIDNHLVANQGDDYCAWTSAGLAVDDGALDALLELGRRPRPVTATADVETVERMRRELYPGAAPKDVN